MARAITAGQACGGRGTPGGPSRPVDLRLRAYGRVQPPSDADACSRRWWCVTFLLVPDCRPGSWRSTSTAAGTTLPEEV